MQFFIVMDLVSEIGFSACGSSPNLPNFDIFDDFSLCLRYSPFEKLSNMPKIWPKKLKKRLVQFCLKPISPQPFPNPKTNVLGTQTRSFTKFFINCNILCDFFTTFEPLMMSFTFTHIFSFFLLRSLDVCK